MSRERKFDEKYYLSAINKIDMMLSNQDLSNDEIELLKEEKLYLYDRLGIIPYSNDKCLNMNDAEFYLHRIAKSMYEQYNHIGLDNINNLILITSFITRHRNERKISYKKVNIDSEDVLNKGMDFFKNYDEEFYNIIKQLISHKENLYDFHNREKEDDRCVFLIHKKLPVVHVCNTQSINLYGITVHEMQHQIDFMYRYLRGSKNPNYNTLLEECSAILTEILFCDQFQQKNSSSDEINNLYLERIKNIEQDASFMLKYLKIMKYLCANKNKFPKINLLVEYFEKHHIEVTESLLIKYINKLHNYNLYGAIKYLFSYLLALDIREIYYNNPYEAINKIKQIINLKVYNFNSLQDANCGFKLSDYKDGAFNHLKHVIRVENDNQQLQKKLTINS